MTRRHVTTPWLLLGVLTCTRGLDAQASVLKLTTNAHGVAREISAFLPNRGDELLPEFGTGERVVMELDKEHCQVFRIEKHPSGAPIMELRFRPGPLKKAIKDRLGLISGLTRAKIFTLFVMEYRAEPRWVARAMKGVTDFPLQLDSLHLVVREPTDGREGLLIDLDMTPRPGTWLARVLAGIARERKGAHLLRTPNAAMSVAAAVQGEALPLLMAPFAEYCARLRGNTKAERQEFRAHAARCVEQLDGSYSLLIDGPGRFVRLVGLEDSARYRGLKMSDVGQRFSHRRVGRWPDAVVASERPAVLDGGPLRVLLRDSDPFALVTEETEIEMHTFAGVVGDFSVKARLPGDGEEAARLTQRIKKRWLRRIPLPKNALVTAEFNLSATRLRKSERTKQLAGMLNSMFDAEDFEKVIGNLPKHMRLSAYKTAADGQPGLRVRIATW